MARLALLPDLHSLSRTLAVNANASSNVRKVFIAYPRRLRNRIVPMVLASCRIPKSALERQIPDMRNLVAAQNGHVVGHRHTLFVWRAGCRTRCRLHFHYVSEVQLKTVYGHASMQDYFIQLIHLVS